MSESVAPDVGEGSAIELVDVRREGVGAHAGALAAVFDGVRTGVVVRGVLCGEPLRRLAARLTAGLGGPAGPLWDSPNRGMAGGEIRVAGIPATPTYAHPKGPPSDRHALAAESHEERVAALLGDVPDPWPEVAAVLAQLAGAAVYRPAAGDGPPWAPYTLRSLGPGQRIHPHHDAHFGLAVYANLDPAVERRTLLSWFVTLEAADAGGALVIYGLRRDRAEVPIAPTGFVDGDALERRFRSRSPALAAGDLVVFDAGRHVHRVTPVEGPRARLTLGGFAGYTQDRLRLAVWS